MAEIHFISHPKVDDCKAVTLEKAIQDIPEWCMVIGYTEEGGITIQSSTGDTGAQLLLLERAKNMIMRNDGY